MAKSNAFGCLEPINGCAEIRLPVANSHGGFAQAHQLVAHAYLDPLGQIPIPASGAFNVPAEPAP